MRYRYLFGPVPSRRLGISLGIDLVPLKTCTLNCVYCECGQTTNLTLARKEYVPTQAVLEELNEYLQNQPRLDFITFAGSGEPTLHRHIDRIIHFLKEHYPLYPLCLLTNGTLFTSGRVREQVKKVDLIIPSLDAATEIVFRQLNRPHRDLRCESVISGLVSLRREFKGELRLEVFIVPGLNDTGPELAALKKAVSRINPDRIQVGTLDRPGAETWVKEAGHQQLQEISAYLEGAEIIPEFKPRSQTACFNENFKETILQIIGRRPCTVDDLSQVLNMRPAEIQKYLRQLLAAGQVELESKQRGTFLKLKSRPGCDS